MTYVPTAQRYPSALSQGQGGPSRRPARNTHTSPSIDDEVPPSSLPPLPQPQLRKSTSRPLNPNVKPYTPQNFRSHQDLRSQYSRSQYPEPTYASIPPPEAFRLFQQQQDQLALHHHHAQSHHPIAYTGARPEYSSLQHLLEQAGYADTRIATPPGERAGRRIKKTFDEVDAEEVRDLYSTFGMSEHRVTHITEPGSGLPIKSSSSLLRNVALQDSNYTNSSEHDQQHHPSQFGTSYDTWWGGRFAAIGRAAKAVLEMSPPSRGAETFEEVAQQMSSSVGLGLARGGEGVRKVRSNWELGRVEIVDQEQIPPIPDYTPTTIRSRRSAIVPDIIIPSLSDLPPVSIDEDDFGFSPLPADYEAQCDDDEFFTTSFDVGSLGDITITSLHQTRESSVEQTREMTEQEREEEEDRLFQLQLDEVNQVNFDSPDSVRSLGFGLSRRGGMDVGSRIMAEAVDYDDFDHDSPTKNRFAKPLPTISAPEAVPKITLQEPTPQPSLASHSPFPSPIAPTPAAAPVLKYADRATKLRLARSTPILTRTPPPSGWFDSFVSYIAPIEPVYTPIPTSADLNPSSSKPAPIKLSPALPAIPALAKPVAVVCDSTSDMAEDLPAIPQTITVVAPPKGAMANLALRTRKSLAHLRSVVYGSASGSSPAPPLPTRAVKPSAENATAPVLSPRLDLAESEYFAGWSPRRPERSGNEQAAEWATPTKKDSHEDGYGPTEIDYTRSFFYKPCTPPSTMMAGAASSSVYATMSSTTTSTTDTTTTSETYTYSSTSTTVPANLVARRQRSIKSLRAALLLPVAPPVPALPSQYTATGGQNRSTSAQSGSTVSTTTIATPPQRACARMGEEAPPVIAILSPGAWEAGLPARQLVLEGEEWDARDGLGPVGSWSRGREGGKGKGKGKLRRKGSKKAVKE